MRTRTSLLLPTVIVMAIMLGSIVTTMGLPAGNKALAYKSKLDQAASLANACGNAEIESLNVLCQNLLSQLNGKGNAANIIGLQQTGGSGTAEGGRGGEDRMNSITELSRIESTSTPTVPDTWSQPWQSLGGVIRADTDPVVVQNTFSDNRLMVFVVGTDNKLHYIQQEQAPDPVDFFPWDQSQSALPGGVVRASSDPAVIMNSDGRLEAFVVGTDNAVWHTSQTDPGSISFSSFQSLGGVVDSNTSPVLERNSDGRLELFVVGTDNALWHRSQISPGSNTWTGWQSLGGALRDNTDPAAVRNADGRLQIFVVGIPNGLYYRSQTSPGSNTWTGYQSLGGEVDPNSNPAAIRNSDGRLEVFVLGTNNALWHMAQSSAGSTVWSSWLSLAGPEAGWRDNQNPAVIMNPDGRLQVFVVYDDGIGRIYTEFQNTAGSLTDWSPLFGVGAPGSVSSNSSPTSVCDEQALTDCAASGPLQVFVRGSLGFGALSHSWRTG
jgi:hypothetical protein